VNWLGFDAQANLDYFIHDSELGEEIAVYTFPVDLGTEEFG
jgi:hypothetical protein